MRPNLIVVQVEEVRRRSMLAGITAATGRRHPGRGTGRVRAEMRGRSMASLRAAEAVQSSRRVVVVVALAETSCIASRAAASGT